MNKQEKLIVFLLVLVAIGLWTYNAQRTKPAPSADPQPPPVAIDGNSEKPAPESEANTANTRPAPESEPAKTQVLKESNEVPAAKPVVIVLQSTDPDKPLAEVTIDPEAGGITTVKLLNYKQAIDGEERVVLGDRDYPMLSLRAQGGLRYSHARILESTASALRIERQILGTSLVVQQSWAFTEDSYRIDYKLQIRNLGDQPATVQDLRLIAGSVGPSNAKGSIIGSTLDLRMQYCDPEGDTDHETNKDIRKFDDKEKRELAAQDIKWFAVQNAFFLALLESKGFTTGCSADVLTMGQELDENGSPKPETGYDFLIGYLHLANQLNLGSQETFDKDFSFYVGPKVYSRLKAQGRDKTSVMGFGRFLWMEDVTFMRWISMLIYKLLLGIYGVVGNYGVAIILTTLVIRIIFSPVTYKSSVWSQRMKEIQPKVKEINEKYAHDPQKKQLMVMELYKEHKINPVAGCLPIFFQIPVFFALFTVLRSAIELRHAGFCLWMDDLSQPDMLWVFPASWPFLGGKALSVLPFTMGGAMYLQQRMMPTSAEPMQQKMMNFMSIFFIFMCYSMPSGLTLYWTVSNCCSIIQYRVTQELLDRRKTKETA